MAPSVDVMSSTQSLPQSADILGAGCLKSCYALAHVGDQSQTGNQLAPQARFHTRAFEKCRILQTLNFERTEHDPREVHRIIPEGCFSEAGLEALTLPADFNWMGPAACERCNRLQTVDISQTEISEILGPRWHLRTLLSAANSSN